MDALYISLAGCSNVFWLDKQMTLQATKDTFGRICYQSRAMYFGTSSFMAYDILNPAVVLSAYF
jgi:hypothetical protein